MKDAVGNGVSVLAWIAGFGNMDDQIGSGLFRFSHSQLESSGGASIPFSRRWDSEGDWELFGHIKATPICRPESKCCDQLKRAIAALERTLAGHEKRIAHLELMARLAELAKGSDTLKMVNKTTARVPPK